MKASYNHSLIIYGLWTQSRLILPGIKATVQYFVIDEHVPDRAEPNERIVLTQITPCSTNLYANMNGQYLAYLLQ